MEFKDIIIKKLHTPRTSLVNLPCDILSDKNKLLNILEKDYIKFNPATETILINNKDINENDFTENDIRKSVLIVPKFWNIKIKSQYDEPYNTVSNQCSWVSKEFIANKDKTIE